MNKNIYELIDITEDDINTLSNNISRMNDMMAKQEELLGEALSRKAWFIDILEQNDDFDEEEEEYYE